jgi:hypothetical protein
MMRWIARIATTTVTAAAILGTVGVSSAYAETPSSCEVVYVCLKNGTMFGAPKEAYPTQSDDQHITAAQIVQDCSTDQETDHPRVSCGFYPYGPPTTVGYGDWEPLTSDYVNCHGGGNYWNITWSGTITYTTSNSVSVGFQTWVDLEVVKYSLDFRYEHSWGKSTGSTQSFSAFVPKGYKAHLKHRYQKQVVKGVLWIDYEHTGTGPMEGHGHHYWAITDFEAVSPIIRANGTVQDMVALAKPTKIKPGDC